MSHNVTLSGIKFSDRSLLQDAFLELKNETPEMAGYELVFGDSTVRGYSGRTTVCPVSIKCPSERYDIGFRQDANGVLTPFMESGFCARGISTDRDAKTVNGEHCSYGHENRALGRLQQRYALLQTEGNARRQGMMTRRVQAENGMIQLEVMGK